MKFGIIVVIYFIMCNYLYCASFALRNEEFRCLPMTTYTVNECNICSCSQEDLPRLICTRMGCEFDDMYTNCIVGTSWISGCNKCWCVSDIGTMCTHRKCNY